MVVGPGSGYPPNSTPVGSRAVAMIGKLWAQAAALMLGFVALLYGIEGVDSLQGVDLDSEGIRPRDPDGLWGVLWAPVLHGNWDHLMGNTLPVLILGFLTLLSGIGRGLAATALIWLIAGAGTWLIGGAGTVHIGASSLVFGWLTFLISRGWFARNLTQIVVGLVVFAIYGSLLWGVLPGQPMISWQGHLFGAVGGVVAGWVLSGDERRRRRAADPRPLAGPR
ncbi:rhomboid family intramembrane serine protease [Nocardia harenae]|uniref:rhomboid family intramembrane serine protease n=1 Tax=Nocardia harenae TaxID=358707 RepID=UPI00082FFA2B